MEGWVTKSISEVISKTKTIDPRKSPEKKFMYVDVSGVSNQTLEITESTKLAGKDAPSRARRVITEGDIIFATVRPTLRRIAVVPSHLDGEVCSTGYFVFQPNSELYNRYLYYFLQSDHFMGEMEKLQKGASYPAVNDSQVKSRLISYPPILEQKRIVALLDTVFADLEQTRAKTEQNLKNARELMNVTFHGAITGKLTKQWREANKNEVTASELLVQLKEQKKKLVSEKSISKEKELPEISEEEVSYELPESWKWCRLGEIGNAINYPFVDGPFGSSINTKKDYLEAGVPVLRMVNVKPFTFKNYNLKYVSEDKYQQFTRHNVLPGDVLFSKVGAGTGESCVVPDSFSYGMLSTTGITRIRVGQVVLNQYLCCFLNSNIEKFMVLASKAAQPFLNMTQIKTFPFPLPPIEEQREIVLILERLSTEIQKVEAVYEKKLLALDDLKKSILQKAFSGELTHD